MPLSFGRRPLLAALPLASLVTSFVRARRPGNRPDHLTKERAPAGALFHVPAEAPYNKVMAGVPAWFGIAVPGAAMCHPTSCNARRDCGVVA